MAQALVDQGVEVITTPDDRWAKVWIKTIGLLPNVMAKQKAHEQGAFDAIFVRDGMVTESTSANVFIVKNGRLWTAPATNYILPGVTRRVVLELALESGLQVIQRPFEESEMAAADEVFLTGTLIEILPVRAVNGKPIAGVGPISHQLLEGLRRRT
jgi:D-alanine transaminase